MGKGDVFNLEKNREMKSLPRNQSRTKTKENHLGVPTYIHAYTLFVNCVQFGKKRALASKLAKTANLPGSS